MRDRLRDHLGIAAIVVFVVVDIVLVTMAFRHVQPDQSSSGDSGAPGEAAATPVDASPAGSPSPSTSRSANAGSGGGTASGPLLLAVGPDGTVLRGNRGSCENGQRPALERSTDGGETFAPLTVDEDLSEVLRVQADAGNTWLVGARQSCRFGVYRPDGGDASSSWSFSRGTGGAWHLVQDPEAERVHTPDGVVDTPCLPVDLSTTGGAVPRLLCDTGAVLGSSDGGQEWVVLGRLDGAVAIAYTSPGDGFALAAQDECAAAVLQTADGGASWDRLECLGDAEPRAVAVHGDAVAAQVGDTLHVSTDGGSSWSPAAG